VAIKFDGEFEVQRKPEEVYEFLIDPQRFAPLLPEFQAVSVQDAEHFSVKVNVGISHIKGVADVKMRLAEARRPERARYEGQGSVAGGNVSMVAGFDLSPADFWTAHFGCGRAASTSRQEADSKVDRQFAGGT
jgi:carbon monoxide dehydrogenase subunit G